MSRRHWTARGHLLGYGGRERVACARRHVINDVNIHAAGPGWAAGRRVDLRRIASRLIDRKARTSAAAESRWLEEPLEVVGRA